MAMMRMSLGELEGSSSEPRPARESAPHERNVPCEELRRPSANKMLGSCLNGEPLLQALGLTAGHTTAIFLQTAKMAKVPCVTAGHL